MSFLNENQTLRIKNGIKEIEDSACGEKEE